jgi:multidrug efflux pump subunit AcrA (membrane-fusion protein)
VPFKVGSTVAANEAVASIISTGKLQIESYVPEIHVPLIRLGNEASVTLDAYGDDTPFRAHVIAIDPAETSRDGVSTYKTTLEFVERDERIKSGMTANIVITSERKSDVLSVPQGALTRKDGSVFLKVREGEVFIERHVETGIVSSSGEIEIVSGLNDGDVVLLELAAAER